MKDYILWTKKPEIDLNSSNLDIPQLAQIIAYVGNNSGNLMYVEGLKRILSKNIDFSDWHSFPQDAKNLIFPAANQLGKHTDLSGLKTYWESTGKNIITVSIGIQSMPDQEPILNRGTKEWLDFLVKQAENKKSFISTRGAHSKSFINNLYKKEIAKVSGCPSQFLSNPEEMIDGLKKRLEKNLLSLTVNSLQETWWFFYKYEEIFIKEIQKYDGKYIVQAPIENILSVLLKNEDKKIISKDDLSFSEVKNICSSNFFHNKSDFFIDINQWMDCVRNYDYNIGCRIHGCMASIAAGVPSFLFTTDTRTKEFAETMNLPYSDDLSLDDPVNFAKEKLKTHDFKKMFQTWRENAKIFKELFEINEVSLNNEFLNNWIN
jgi:hypothetical protein